MRSINTRGIKQANKHNLSRLSGILMAALVQPEEVDALRDFES